MSAVGFGAVGWFSSPVKQVVDRVFSLSSHVVEQIESASLWLQEVVMHNSG